MSNTAEKLPDWTPRDFIERAQIDADQKSYDVTAATADISALYHCAETRTFVEANYGSLRIAHTRLGAILHHMDQIEHAKKRAA